MIATVPEPTVPTCAKLAAVNALVSVVSVETPELFTITAPSGVTAPTVSLKVTLPVPVVMVKFCVVPTALSMVLENSTGALVVLSVVKVGAAATPRVTAPV